MASEQELRGLELELSDESQDQFTPDVFALMLQSQAPQTPRVTSMLAGQAAMIAGSPYEVESLHLAAAGDDPVAYTEQTTREWFNKRKLNVRDRMANTQYASAQAMTEAALDEAENLRRISEMEASPVAQSTAYTTQAAIDGDPLVIAEKVYEHALATEMKRLTDDLPLGDTIANYAGSVLPFFTAADVQDIADEVGKTPELAEVAGADLEEFVDRWQGLPASKRTELLPHLSDALVRASDTLGWTENELRASQFLSAFLDFDPSGALRKQQFEDVAFSAFDFIPTTGVVKAMRPAEKVLVRNTVAKAVDEALNNTHAAKVAVDAGDMNSAARHTLAATLDDVTADALGTTRVDAAMSALPLETNQWFKRVVDDDALPSAVADEINKAAAQANGFTSDMLTGNGLMRMGILNPNERVQAVGRFNQVMDGLGEDYLLENLEMGNLRITSQSKDGFKFSYTLKDKANPTTEGGKERLTLKTGEVQFKLNDVTGKFTATMEDPFAQNKLAARTLSPSTWSVRGADNADFNLEVYKELAGSDVAVAYQQGVERQLVWAWEPVAGLTRGNVRRDIEAIVMKGDEWVNEGATVQGKTFTPTELAAGIDTARGRVYLTDPKAVEAYYRIRLYADSMYRLEDSVLRRELELGGFKNVRLHALANTPDGATVANVRNASEAIGRPFERVGDALASVRDKRGQGVWDDKAGRTMDLNDEYVRQVYEEGDVLVRLRQDWNTKGTGELDRSGEFVQYARVSKSRVSDLPVNVLHYRDGYVPKINEAKFMVTRVHGLRARGRPSLSRSEAVRGFDSLADAQKFREEQILKHMAEEDVTREVAENVFPEVKLNTDLTPAERLEGAVAQHSGLYHGMRAKEEVLFGMNGEKMSRVSPIEAFQRHAQHLGGFFTMNEVRLAREKRWLDSVRQSFPDVEIRGFDNTAIPSGTAKAKAAEEMRRQIREWNNIPSREEDLFEGQIQRMHDWALDKLRKGPFGLKDKNSIKSMQWLMHKDGYSAIKSAVMHNLLGFFNPAQLYTQASALTVAASKYPRHALAGTEAAIGWAVLDLVKNGRALPQAMRILKGGRIINESTEAGYNAWRRTGLAEAVYNNSDLARITTTGFGVTNKLLRSADFLSLFLYRGGELASRRFTFMTEFAEWSRRTGKTVPSDDELMGILEEVHKNLLSLGPANKAWWQGGQGTGSVRQMLGVTSQFMQVGTKTMELIMKNEGRGGFTAAQRRRIFMGQAALFGAAGVPAGNWLVNQITAAMGVTEAHPTMVDLVNQGIVGGTVNLMAGAYDSDESWAEYAQAVMEGRVGPTLQVSERFALGTQATEMVVDFINSEDPLWTRIGGPAGSGLLGRAYDSLQEMEVLTAADFTDYQDMDVPMWRMGMAVLEKAMQDLPSTSRNYMKYLLMKNHHKIINRNSKLQVAKDFRPSEELGALFGVTPTVEAETYILKAQQRWVDEAVAKYARLRANMAHSAIYELGLKENEREAVAYALQILDTSVDPYIAQKGREAYKNLILNPETEDARDKLTNKFLERTAPEKLSHDILNGAWGFQGGAGSPAVQPFSQWLHTQQPEGEE